MVCQLTSAKLSPEPVLEYCQLEPLEQTSVKFQAKFIHFHKKNLKTSSAKWWPFSHGLNVLRYLLPAHKSSYENCTYLYMNLCVLVYRYFCTMSSYPIANKNSLIWTGWLRFCTFSWIHCWNLFCLLTWNSGLQIFYKYKCIKIFEYKQLWIKFSCWQTYVDLGESLQSPIHFLLEKLLWWLNAQALFKSVLLFHCALSLWVREPASNRWTRQ